MSSRNNYFLLNFPDCNYNDPAIILITITIQLLCQARLRFKLHFLTFCLKH
ncbi:unnamed protein product [Brugia timori]|uniref:Uncharacterized protein n=1 Tax=Brugia timori TaxID=42155 RepID=A0A3P7UWC5_9BILA|nr:unnamed protein product [Brugia timori]